MPTHFFQRLFCTFARLEGSLVGGFWNILKGTHASFFDTTLGSMMVSFERGLHFWEQEIVCWCQVRIVMELGNSRDTDYHQVVGAESLCKQTCFGLWSSVKTFRTNLTQILYIAKFLMIILFTVILSMQISSATMHTLNRRSDISI